MKLTGLAVRFLLILLATALAACSDSPTGPTFDEFRGTWDGEAWKAKSYAILQDDSLRIVAHWSHPDFFYDEFIVASVAFDGPGLYDVHENTGQLMKLTGGDAGEVVPAAGTLTITNYDADARTIEGTLSLQGEATGTLWTVSGEFAARVFPSPQAVPQM